MPSNWNKHVTVVLSELILCEPKPKGSVEMLVGLSSDSGIIIIKKEGPSQPCEMFAKVSGYLN